MYAINCIPERIGGDTMELVAPPSPSPFPPPYYLVNAITVSGLYRFLSNLVQSLLGQRYWTSSILGMIRILSWWPSWIFEKFTDTACQRDNFIRVSPILFKLDTLLPLTKISDEFDIRHDPIIILAAIFVFRK